MKKVIVAIAIAIALFWTTLTSLGTPERVPSPMPTRPSVDSPSSSTASPEQSAPSVVETIEISGAPPLGGRRSIASGEESAALARVPSTRLDAPSRSGWGSLPSSPSVSGRDDSPSDGRALEGLIVSSEDGAPVPDATVTLARWGGLEPIALRRTTVSGERGEFRFEGLGARPYRLTARRAGFAQRTMPANIEGELCIHLDPERVQRGRVIGASGEAIAGAHVRVTHPGDELRAVDVSAGDGSFEIRELGHAPVTVTVSRRDHATWSRTGGFGESGEVLEVRLVGGVALRGVVVDASTSAPIAGATIRFAPAAGRDKIASGWVLSGVRGLFVLSDLQLGPWNITISAPGHATHRFEVDLVAATDRVFPLTNGGVIRGLVTDEEGQGIAGVSIQVGSQDDPEVFRVVTDLDGSFVATGLSQSSYRLVMTHADYAHRQVVLSVGDEPQTWVLEKPATLIGRIREENGRAATGWLWVERTDGDYTTRHRLGRDGRYSATGLPAGAYRVGYQRSRRAERITLAELALEPRTRTTRELRLDGS